VCIVRFVLFGKFTTAAIKPGVGVRYRFGPQADRAMPTVSPLCDDTCDFEDFDVLGYCLERDRKQRRQLVHRHLPSRPEVLHDGAAHRITQRPERPRHTGVDRPVGDSAACVHDVGS
jgi:hypothetical protein